MPQLLRNLITSLSLSILLSSAILGCSSTPTSKHAASTGASSISAGKSSILTRDAAMYRSRQVDRIRYKIWLSMNEASEAFEGRTKLYFNLRENAFQNINHLRVDFTGGEIRSILINGNAWDSERISKRYDGERIEFERKDVKVGQNEIEISYVHPYSKSGNGLYRFKDPEDGNVYIYSNLEPYYANLIFPAFDQPDLKASFELTVEAPKGWTIIGNMPLRDRTGVDGRHSWQFSPTPLMSTYLFAVAAGPWKEWKSKHGRTPMALFARSSLARYVDHTEWFEVTGKGLDFFSEFFDLPYPYAKYDQILVPDHTAGAMENVGAVTFNESFVFRGKATEDERRDRADTILHEMAHMWFGNLVTMRWWNGLWLNESFATYLASVAVERTKLFPGAPQSFFSGMKRWAYSEDQQPTTHPIEVSVADTNQAMANFDGITYGKGAAALKQLHFLLGDADFKEGLNRYFTRFANRNTALVDFMNLLGQAASRDLAPWSSAWLHTSGYSRIGVDFACEAGKISRLDLSQRIEGEWKGKAGANALRPHKLRIGLYYKDSSGKLVRKGEGITASIETDLASVEEAIGERCPDLVFPNDGDHGYFLVDLDPKSIETAKTSLDRVSDPFTRHLLAFTLWEMVKAGQWKAEEFADAALGWLRKENDKTLLEDLGGMLAHPRGRITAAKVLVGEKRAKLLGELFALSKRKAQTSAAGSDLQRIWFDLALRSLGAQDAEWALSVYRGKTKLPGLKIDQDLRWDILASVARIQSLSPSSGASEKATEGTERKTWIDDALLSSAAKDDPSSTGNMRLLSIRATLGSPITSSEGVVSAEELYTLAKTDSAIPQARIRQSMGGFLDYRNETRASEWKPKYFSSLVEVAKKADDSYARGFASALYPSDCSVGTANETRAWISKNRKRIPDALRITLEKLAFSEGWCAAIRAGQTYPLWSGK